MNSPIAKETERACVLCCQEVDVFAVGKCDHPVCYRCSTKMRVLCDQKYCAVCREELDKVGSRSRLWLEDGPAKLGRAATALPCFREGARDRLASQIHGSGVSSRLSAKKTFANTWWYSSRRG